MVTIPQGEGGRCLRAGPETWIFPCRENAVSATLPRRPGRPLRALQRDDGRSPYPVKGRHLGRHQRTTTSGPRASENRSGPGGTVTCEVLFGGPHPTGGGDPHQWDGNGNPRTPGEEDPERDFPAGFWLPNGDKPEGLLQAPSDLELKPMGKLGCTAGEAEPEDFFDSSHRTRKRGARCPRIGGSFYGRPEGQID